MLIKSALYIHEAYPTEKWILADILVIKDNDNDEHKNIRVKDCFSCWCKMRTTGRYKIKSSSLNQVLIWEVLNDSVFG